MSLNIAGNQNLSINRLALHWPPSLPVAEEQFFDFCQVNRELHIERNAAGDCEIMVPTGWETGRKNLSLAAQLYIWAERDGTGIASDSSTGFILPNGAMRSPDAAWVRNSRLARLTAEQKQGFLPLCPDFIIELKSPSDHLKSLQEKMQEYIINGANLGWLIDCDSQQVFVFQPEQSLVVLEKPAFLSDDTVLAGFILDLQKIW